jgi:hypothetical protein
MRPFNTDCAFADMVYPEELFVAVGATFADVFAATFADVFADVFAEVFAEVFSAGGADTSAGAA